MDLDIQMYILVYMSSNIQTSQYTWVQAYRWYIPNICRTICSWGSSWCMGRSRIPQPIGIEEVEYISTRDSCISTQLKDMWYTNDIQAQRRGYTISILDSYNKVFVGFISVYERIKTVLKVIK